MQRGPPLKHLVHHSRRRPHESTTNPAQWRAAPPPTRKALALVAAGAVVFGLAMIAPAAGSALGVAAAVVAVMPSDRRGGKGDEE